MACGWIFLSMPSRADDIQLKDTDLFSDTNLIRILVDIPSEGLESLSHSSGGRRRQGKPEAQATVREGNYVYTNVSVRLKGFSTFRNIDSFPSLTLDFNRFIPKQKFHGLTKISLNNSLQDSTRLHEKLSRELFAAAKIPVPRSDFALLTLNGRDLGLYVLAEGFTKKFLEQHFRRSDGILYEGGILGDIDRPMQTGFGQFTTNDARIQRLIECSREPDPSKRLRELEQILDLNRFLTLTAMETILCHSDCYSMNRNNYRLYDDPISGKFVFMPHGMDRVLGTHRSPLDLPVVPPALGMVARAILSTDEGRARYIARARELYTDIFIPEMLCRRVHEIDAKISQTKTNVLYAQSWSDARVSSGTSNHADNLCQRIATRAAYLKMQFDNPGELLAPAPEPNFDSNGVATIPAWRPERTLDQPEVSCTSAKDNAAMWYLTTAHHSNTLTMRACITLHQGTYRVTGTVKSWDASQRTNSMKVTFSSNNSTHYAVDQRALDARNIHFEFTISKTREPDEVELSCEINTMARELWFDPSSLRISEVWRPVSRK
jgi:hypothetical protein